MTSRFLLLVPTCVASRIPAFEPMSAFAKVLLRSLQVQPHGVRQKRRCQRATRKGPLAFPPPRRASPLQWSFHPLLENQR